jgi:uncharacterized DUF497 family protein
MARKATLPPRDIEGFEWDEGNQSELAAHNIYEYEAEQVFYNGPVWPKNRKSGSGDRFMIGYTDANRALTLVVQIKRHARTLRVITGWDCEPEDRRRYLVGRRS